MPKVSLFAAVLLSSTVVCSAWAGSRSSVSAMIMIGSPREEKEAAVLIDSLRTFGGEFARMPVVVVLSDPSRADGRTLAEKVQETATLKMDEDLRQFPFADKVYACAQVEALVADKVDWLLWLNPDCLIVAPPSEIAASSEAWAALRPVHLQNIGAPAAGAVPEYWSRIYELVGLDPARAWTVESLVDHRKLRAYFNSGCMAFVPAKGILRAWRDNFERLLRDPASRAFYTSDRSYAIFCHQAVLSAVVAARVGRERTHLLPPSYGYPLQLQDQPGFTNRSNDLAELTIVITGGFDQLANIAMTEPFTSWVRANVP